MARLPISLETRRQLNDDDRRWKIKLRLRALAIPLAIIAMILFAVTTSLSKLNYGGNDWTDGLPLAPVLLALFYNPLVLFLTLFQRNGRSIHPGWNVGVDLLVWGLAVPSIIFSIGDGWFWYWEPVLLEFDNFVPCNTWWNFWSSACSPLIYQLGRTEIAANVFLAFILIIHFTLFVYACIATHKLRKRKQQDAAERRNIELQYHRSPEEHRQSQPPAYTPSAEGNARLPASVVSEDDNPFKDAEATAESNPFHDDHRGAVKYA